MKPLPNWAWRTPAEITSTFQRAFGGPPMTLKRLTDEQLSERSAKRIACGFQVVVEFIPTGTPEGVSVAGWGDRVPPYLMVLEGTNEDTGKPVHWFSGHFTKAMASLDWSRGENRDRWEPVLLVNLDTGERYKPVIVLRWEEIR